MANPFGSGSSNDSPYGSDSGSDSGSEASNPPADGGEVVGAQQPSPVGRFFSWVRDHPGAAVVGSAAVGLLLAAGVGEDDQPRLPEANDVQRR